MTHVGHQNWEYVKLQLVVWMYLGYSGNFSVLMIRK